jgi:DNA polymerase elongation subunit (family B)
MSTEDKLLYEKYINESQHYDQMQYTYKIKLNSSYGALTNLHFRFFDLRLGESTTGTGRVIIIHQARKISEILDGTYNVDFPTYETIKDAETEGHSPDTALHGPKFKGKFMSDSIVAGDTDSGYFKTHATNKEEAIQIADAVAVQVNASFKEFMQRTFLCNPGYDDKIKCAREVVSTKAIFVKKKHYLMHICNLDGKPVDKMKIMGVATKKTTLPKVVSTKLNGFIEQLLKDRDWDDIAEDVVAYKIQLRNSANIFDLGLPKGVNGVEQYTANYALDPKCRIPGHVAASIHYNQLLLQYDDKTSLPITSGTKIKVFYLVGDHGKFKSIAIPTDAGKIPQWCLDNFKIDIDAQMTRLIDKPLEGILNAIGKRVPTRAGITFDSIFEF